MARRFAPLVLLAIALSAQAEGRSPFVIVPNVRIWGADVTIGYRGISIVPGLDTVFWGHVGGGWQSQSLYRDFPGSSPVVGVPTGADWAEAGYRKLTLDWQAGVSQGIVWSERLDRNLLEGVLLAKWRVDRYSAVQGEASALISSSALPDRDGIFLTSFLAALRWDGVEVVPSRQTMNGMYAELSADWAPAGLFGSPADFVRLNGHLSGLVTLVDLPHLALVAGDRLEGDLLVSPSGELAAIPVLARTSFGGMNPDGFGGESGLGGAVRGVHGERFDGTLKIVNNLELRLLFPELLPIAIFPGVVAYVDAGVSDFRRLDRAPSLPEDLLLSAGLGVSLRALVADILLYGSYCLAPAEAAGLKVDFRFSTQF